MSGILGAQAPATNPLSPVNPATIKIFAMTVQPGVLVDIAYDAYNSNDFDVTVRFLLSGTTASEPFFSYPFERRIRAKEIVRFGLVDTDFNAKEPAVCSWAIFSVTNVWR